MTKPPNWLRDEHQRRAMAPLLPSWVLWVAALVGVACFVAWAVMRDAGWW